MRWNRCWRLLLLIAPAWLSSAAGAAALKVYPVRILLDPKRSVQTMVIHNEDAQPVRVQLQIFAWRQVDGQDVFEETRDVLANPPLFEIPAGQDQIARFGLRTVPGAVEKSYRVFLQEIPDAAAAAGQVRTLLRISIPVFVPPTGEASARTQWMRLAPAGAKARIVVRNDGTSHVQINRISILDPKGTLFVRADLSAYLLPGAERSLTVDMLKSLPEGAILRLVAETDQGKIETTIASEAAAHGAVRP